MVEIWKDVCFEDNGKLFDYTGLYKVSNFGNVISLYNGSIGKYRETPKQMKLNKGKNGYLRVNLYKDGNKKQVYVHRLVAFMFIDNPENKKEIDHIDTIRTNNHVSNLRWVTTGENANNPLTSEKKRIINTGKKRDKESVEKARKKVSRPVIGTNLETGEVVRFDSAEEAGRNGFNRSHVSGCCRGERLTHKGYTWKWEEGSVNPKGFKPIVSINIEDGSKTVYETEELLIKDGYNVRVARQACNGTGRSQHKYKNKLWYFL